MLNLDLRTIVVISGILALLLAVVMLLLRLSYPRSIKGLGYWVLAPLLVGLATFLLAARGRIPDLPSVVGANLSLLVGVLLFHFGTQRFFDLKPSYRLWVPVMLAVLPLLVWFSVIRPDFNARVMLVCMLWAGIALANALTIWRYGPEEFATRYTVIVLMAHVSVIVMRGITALLPLPKEGLFEPTRIQTLYITTNALAVTAFMIGLVLMVSERVRAELEHLATHDSLTGAMVRRILVDSAALEFDRCRRHGRPMALMMLDLDHFKTINDTYGHQMGDRVLVDFVQRVQPLLRRHDQLGRFGGEEFLVLLPETTVEEAQGVAERIRTRMAIPSGDLPLVTVSIGITSNRDDDHSIDMLLARADQALYQAKSAGRDRVAVV